MEFNEVIKSRFSCRKFSDKNVSKEYIDKILEAGRIAPTAKNIQPFKIYVVESNEGLNSIDKASPCRYNAPVVLVVLADKNISYTKTGFNSYIMDASIVTTHMMLEATNLGLDNIWIEMFDADVIKEKFNVPENLEAVVLLPIGYRLDGVGPSRLHDSRKNVEELVEYK